LIKIRHEVSAAGHHADRAEFQAMRELHAGADKHRPTAPATGAAEKLAQALTIVGGIFQRDDVRVLSQPIDYVQRDVVMRRDRNVVKHKRQRHG
jgi:hypothetical protein